MFDFPLLRICCANCTLYDKETNKCNDCDDSRLLLEYCTAFSPKQSAITSAIFRYIQKEESNK